LRQSSPSFVDLENNGFPCSECLATASIALAFAAIPLLSTVWYQVRAQGTAPARLVKPPYSEVLKCPENSALDCQASSYCMDEPGTAFGISISTVQQSRADNGMTGSTFYAASQRVHCLLSSCHCIINHVPTEQNTAKASCCASCRDTSTSNNQHPIPNPFHNMYLLLIPSPAKAFRVSVQVPCSTHKVPRTARSSLPRGKAVGYRYLWQMVTRTKEHSS
jgi:hypothetical protein